MLLSFLLENQEKITSLQKQMQPLEDIRIQCENILSSKKDIGLFSQFFQTKEETKLISHYIPDENFSPLFKAKKTGHDKGLLSENHTTENIFALFSSPLEESWKEIMACKGDEQFAIRTGFHRDEFDIFQSILMGFQGLTIYVTGLDCFQIQYLTEVARDYLFSVFFVVHNKEELNLVLETDAPYIIFSAYQKKNFMVDTSLLYNLSQFVPKSANLFALAPEGVLKDKKNLQELGYSGLICS